MESYSRFFPSQHSLGGEPNSWNNESKNAAGPATSCGRSSDLVDAATCSFFDSEAAPFVAADSFLSLSNGTLDPWFASVFTVPDTIMQSNAAPGGNSLPGFSAVNRGNSETSSVNSGCTSHSSSTMASSHHSPGGVYPTALEPRYLSVLQAILANDGSSTSSSESGRSPSPYSFEDSVAEGSDLTTADLSADRDGREADLEEAVTVLVKRQITYSSTAANPAPYTSVAETQKAQSVAPSDGSSIGSEHTLTSRSQRQISAVHSRRRGSGGVVVQCEVTGCDRVVPHSKSTKIDGVIRFLCVRHGGGKRCSVADCTKAAQSRGLCKGHGGGPRCRVEGCSRSSQGGGRCRTHGGGIRCKVAGCDKGIQRFGRCAVHGILRICSFEGCRRTDRGGGLCVIHGGGKRCSVESCERPAHEQGLCVYHFSNRASSNS